MTCRTSTGVFSFGPRLVSKVAFTHPQYIRLNELQLGHVRNHTIQGTAQALDVGGKANHLLLPELSVVQPRFIIPNIDWHPGRRHPNGTGRNAVRPSALRFPRPMAFRPRMEGSLFSTRPGTRGENSLGRDGVSAATGAKELEVWKWLRLVLSLYNVI